MFTLNFFVDLDYWLANLLILDQESAQFAESCYFISKKEFWQYLYELDEVSIDSIDFLFSKFWEEMKLE